LPPARRRFSVGFWKSDLIDVRVKERILWIGSEAYPLQNIARARTAALPSQRGSLVWRFVKSVALWIVVVGVASLVLQSMGAPSVVDFLMTIALLALIVWRLIELLKVLQNGPLYALVVETSGSPRTGLVSGDRAQLTDLVDRIMNAISNPHAEFQVTAQNVHVGDNFTMVGDNIVGKQVGRP
jgi:Family of unknown function (DUF6232)